MNAALNPPPPSTHCSYQLLIRVEAPATVRVGALGVHRFDAGWYLYTGSARRSLTARLTRHLRREKKLRWHIDHLLAAPGVTVTGWRTSARSECAWNRAIGGKVVMPGFGASDCRSGCGAHLKRLSDSKGCELQARFHSPSTKTRPPGR